MDPTAEQLIARLRRNPDDFEAFAALRAHYHHQADYASLANLLEGWAARSTDPISAADAYLEAADLCRDRLSDRGRAMSLYERALERHPMHMNASVRLQEIFEQMGDNRRLLEILERRAEALEDAKADPQHIAQTHQLMGEIWEQKMKRVDRAVGHYRRAFELDSSLVAAIYAAREIYRTAGNLKATASLYELEINAETDQDRKVALLRELAHMRGEQLGDLEGAVAALKRAQSQLPTDLSVMHDLATVLLSRADSSADVAKICSTRWRRPSPRTTRSPMPRQRWTRRPGTTAPSSSSSV
jgi:tetratricopeptide (TPR) repeat protein